MIIRERETSFDVFRGIAIIAVVSIHTLHFTNEISFLNISTVLYRNSINFAVPLFLTLSGYFCAKKSYYQKNYLQFLKKQISKVYIPVIVYSFLLSMILYILNPTALGAKLIKIVSCSTIGPYYFIALIMQFYIILPILKKSFYFVAASFLVSCAFCTLIFTIRYYLNIEIPLILYAGIFPTWIVFFVYGLYLSEIDINIKNSILIPLTIVTYLLSNIETLITYFYFYKIGDAVTAVKITSFMYSLCIITLLMKNKNIFHNRILSTLGKMSFGIFLIHIPIIMFFSKIFSSSLLLLLFTIATTYVIVTVSQKILPVNVLHLLGFN